MSRMLSVLIVLAVASPSFAQVFYAPVQYQYGTQNKFYYGGSDPRVIARETGPASSAQTWGRVHGFDFASGNTDTHREVTGEPDRVYTDAIPGQNARIFGFTASDARNEAYANASRYFRKADVINTAVPTREGWVVPAQAGSDDARYYVSPRAAVAPTTTRAATPRPMMIIPKKALEKSQTPPLKVASAK